MTDTAAREETTFAEVIRRIREGTFYDDHDWASGPALRALDRAEKANRASVARGLVDMLCDATDEPCVGEWSEVIACPHCGLDDDTTFEARRARLTTDGQTIPAHWMIGCDRCGAYITASTKKVCAYLWNSRNGYSPPGEPPLPGITAKVRDALLKSFTPYNDYFKPNIVCPGDEDFAKWASRYAAQVIITRLAQDGDLDTIITRYPDELANYEPHTCDNCDGIDPASCLFNPPLSPQTAIMERAIARALKPYTDYLVQQGNLTGTPENNWHLWLARRCSTEALAALGDPIDVPALVRFMTDFVWNCPTDISFTERVTGNEKRIIADFKAGVHPYESAEAIVLRTSGEAAIVEAEDEA